MEICKRCKFKSTCSVSSESDFCLNYESRPQTNGDKIRDMTDEELAGWICDQIIDRNIGIPAETWLVWLQREADE